MTLNRHYLTIKLQNNELLLRLEDNKENEIKTQILDFRTMTLNTVEQTIDYLLRYADKRIVL